LGWELSCWHVILAEPSALNGLVGTVFGKYWRAKKLAWEKVLALRIGRDSGF
jgi:hypothetical protein